MATGRKGDMKPGTWLICPNCELRDWVCEMFDECAWGKHRQAVKLALLVSPPQASGTNAPIYILSQNHETVAPVTHPDDAAAVRGE